MENENLKMKDFDTIGDLVKKLDPTKTYQITATHPVVGRITIPVEELFDNITGETFTGEYVKQMISDYSEMSEEIEEFHSMFCAVDMTFEVV